MSYLLRIDRVVCPVRLGPLAPVISRCEYEVVMPRVFAKESNQIVKAIQVLRNRQQDPVAVTNTEKVTAARAAQMLNQVDVRERKSLAVKN